MVQGAWGFIGCGNLAQALIVGALEKKVLAPSQIYAVDHDLQKIKTFVAATKINVANSVGQLADQCEVLVLATKPQDILEPLKEVAVHAGENHLIVSLAAGVSGALLEKFLVKPRVVVRVMANTAATVQKGLFGILFVKDCDEEESSRITDFFRSLGDIVLLHDDSDVDAVTSASASGIGFVFSFMEEFEKWLLKKGFEKEEARSMVVTTFLGAAELARNKSRAPITQLKEQVTSKKGTTLAGLTAMKSAKVYTGLRSGLDAASLRSRAIAKSLLKAVK